MTTKIITICLLFFTGQAFETIFSRRRMPSSLIVIFLGYLLANVFNLIKPIDFYESLPIVAQSLLFVTIVQCAFLLKAKELLKFSLISTALATTNLILVASATSLVAKYGFNFPFDQSLYLGIILGGTSLFVAPYFLTSTEDNPKFNSILVYESVFAISLTSVLGFFLLDILQLKEVSAGPLVLGILPNILKSGSIGIAAGLLWAFIKKRLNQFTPSVFSTEIWCLLTYVFIEHINLNGLIGILAFGFMVSNLELTPGWLIKHLKLDLNQSNGFPLLKGALIILKTFIYLYIGMSLRFTNSQYFILSLIIVLFIFLFRYLSVRIFLKSDTYSINEAMTLTSFGMRGFIVASLAVLPLTAGVEGSRWITQVAFLVIPLSIVSSIILKSLSELNFINKKSILFSKYAISDTIDSFEADATDAFTQINTQDNEEFDDKTASVLEKPIDTNDNEVIYEAFESTDPMITSEGYYETEATQEISIQNMEPQELTGELDLNDQAELTGEIELNNQGELTSEITLEEQEQEDLTREIEINEVDDSTEKVVNTINDDESEQQQEEVSKKPFFKLKKD